MSDTITFEHDARARGAAAHAAVERHVEGARRVLEHVSPSQVEAFLRCPRVWFFGWILRLPRKTTPAQGKGSAIHALIEHLLETGQVLEAWHVGTSDTYVTTKPENTDGVTYLTPMVRALVPLLPPLDQPGVSREQWVPRAPWYPGGPAVNGRYDIVERAVAEFNGAPRLSDTKSRSDFRYCKDPAELAKDVQMTSYAAVLADEWGLPDGADFWLRHLYTRTRGAAKAQAVEVRVSVGELRAARARTGEIVRQMVAWAGWASAQPAGLTADAVPTNAPDACKAFGGCDHLTLCFDEDKPVQIRRKPTSEEAVPMTNDILERMRKNKPGAETTAQQPLSLEPAGPAIPAGASTGPTIPLLAQPAQPAAPAPGVPAPGVPAPAAPAPAARTFTTAPDARPAGNGQIYTQHGDHGEKTEGWVMRAPRTPDEVRIASQPVTPPAAPAVPTPAAAPVSEEHAAYAKLEAAGLMPLGDSTSQIFEQNAAGNYQIRSTTPAEARALVRFFASKNPTPVVPPDAPPRTDPPAAAAPPAPVIPTPDEKPKRGRKPKAKADETPAAPTIAEAVQGAADAVASEAADVFEQANAARGPRQAAPAATPDAERIAYLEMHCREQSADIEKLTDELVELRRRASSLPPGAAAPFTLYIDCTPTKGDALADVMDVEDWLAPIAEAVAQGKGKADWRMIDFTAEGDLAAGIAEVLRLDPGVLPRAMRVATRSRIRGPVLDVLLPRATQVVRGVQ